MPPAGSETAPSPGPVQNPAAVRWTVTSRPDVDLWYHGLAYTGFGATAEQPIYDPGYVERTTAAKRQAGVYPTPLDRRAAEFASRFASEPRYEVLQFLPLYFPSAEVFSAALGAWIQSGGDPRRVQNPQLAQAVAFLSQQFPTARDRQTLAEWLEVLEEEERLFWRQFYEEWQRELAGVSAAVQARWDELAPELQPFLDYLMLNGGEFLLSLPIGSEGRTVDLGRRNNRVATLMPSADQPEAAVWAVVHELTYPLVGTVIEDQLAPAQRRELNEELLARRAAVRAGAMLLDRVAPDAAPDYRAAHLRWGGASVPASAAARERALVDAYPLPAPVAEGLAAAIDRALGGI